MAEYKRERIYSLEILDYALCNFSIFVISKSRSSLFERITSSGMIVEERDLQITNIENLHKAKSSISNEKILSLKKSAIQNENLFERLMDVSKYLSLGQMTQTLYEVGGQYRRNM